MRLLIATTNTHKLIEIRAILAGLPFSIDSLDQHPEIEKPEEQGATFAENARAKATYYSGLTHQMAVAEDSGLEIDALDGAPGVLSARFNGASYLEKFSAINELLKAKGVTGSAARFVCALAVADGSRVLFEAAGILEGCLSPEPRGTNGFGYDPIFFYPPYGRTLAEVSAEEKATVSHRGKAFHSLRTYIESNMITSIIP